MNCRVVICRPQPGADASAARARTHGLIPVIYPLFSIEAIEWAPPDPRAFDAVMLTSANATRHAGANLMLYRERPIFAVGDATAKAANNAGLSDVQIAGPNAGALAQDIERAGYRNILHLCGAEVRPFDPGALNITRMPVYRTVEAGDATGLAATLESGSIILTHSPKAAARLEALVPASARHDLSLIAISQAALAAAGTGWRDAQATDEPTDSAMLALAHQICQEGGVASSRGII
ncbi:MAG: uroporphyrinogen-III synthase [Sphingobium sp.]